MSPSTETSTPVEYLLAELSRVKRERDALVGKLRRMKLSRDKWRAEAWYWKRGCLGKFTHGTPRFIRDDLARRTGEKIR